MKSALHVVPESEEEDFVRGFDLREIDASPPTFWTRKWWARIDAVFDIVARLTPKGGRILDVACANGNVTTILGERGFRCVGLDLRHGFLTYAAKKDEFRRASWVVGNALEPPFQLSTFDTVIMGEVLEHVARPDSLIKAGLQLVKPGGAVVCTTPNGACFRNSNLPSYTAASKDPEDLLARQFGPAGEDHLFALRPGELLDLVPENARATLQFVVSGLWNRGIAPLARFGGPSRAVEWLSTRAAWKEKLCDTLVLVALRRS